MYFFKTYKQYFCPGKSGHYACETGRYGNIKNATTLKEGCPYQCPPGKYGVGVGRQFEYSACALCQAGKYGVIEAPTWKCKDMPIQYSIKACYSVENFDSSTSKWHAFTSQNSGEQFTGIGKASRTEIIRKKIDSYSKSRHITYVQGSVETGIDFGDIIKSETYTVCSVQRYTGSTMEKILQGTGNGEWWHGHYKGYTGSFKYGGNFDRAIPGKRKGTPSSTTEYTRHNWIASCATNVVNSTYFVNGNEYYASGGKAVTKGIAINPENRDQKSDWGVAFLATWDYELSREQLKKISKWLNPNISSPLFLDYPRIPCLPCAAGKYNNEVGKLTCQNCMSGRYGANDKCENGLRAIQKKDKGVSYDVNCDYPGDSVAKSIGISSIPCDKLPGVENCLSTKEAIDKNTCQHFGMDIIVPRSEAHWKKLLERYDESYFSVVPGIYKETDGQPVEVPMNSDAMTATGKHGYRALDGGKWWLRDDVVSQPDKNYTKFAWLKILNITDTSNIQFFALEYTTNKYICSFNNQHSVPLAKDCIQDLNKCNTQSDARRTLKKNMEINCKKCRSGKHGTMNGATNETEGCEQCKLGKFAVQDGSPVCNRECSPGKYQAKTSSSNATDPDKPGVCTACNPGFYCPEKNGERVAIPCVRIFFLCSFCYIRLTY